MYILKIDFIGTTLFLLRLKRIHDFHLVSHCGIENFTANICDLAHKVSEVVNK